MAVCVGPPDVIAMGSATVIIGNMPAARIGDMTAHGGAIVVGCPTVIIGDVGMGGGGGAQAGTMKAAKLAGAAFTKLSCDAAKVGPIKTDWVGLGGAYGSQAATMSAAKKQAKPFITCPITSPEKCSKCDKSCGE
jgi:hypothetical protein